MYNRFPKPMGWGKETKMEYASLLGLILLFAPCKAVNMCTSMVQQGRFLMDNQILNLTMPGILSCYSACLISDKCMSFNFNTETHECQLNRETKVSTLTHTTRREHFVFSQISHCVKVAGCFGRPAGWKNGHILETNIPEKSPLGTVLAYTCDPGYMPRGNLVCQKNSTWSSPVCVTVSSCSMVKQYLRDSEDGEYWLRLNNFDNYRTKIYCHNMSTSSPQEFLTLPNINYGIYPRVTNPHCTKETELVNNCKGEGGEIWFSKIRINISTMEVALKDKTFTNISHSEKRLYYGSAWDCYTLHQNNKLRCGTKGRFNIDLRGTGWRISEDQKWKPSGYEAIIESIDRQMNGTVINLRCGGYGGRCRPKGGLFLTPFPEGLSK